MSGIQWDEAPDTWYDHDLNTRAIEDNSFLSFIAWEAASRDIIDFKKIYVDMVGDLNAGLMLSEIVYWYLPSKEDKSRLRVKREGEYWIACRRYEWWDRTRMSPKQADRAIDLLIKAGLIEKRLFKFQGEPTVHVRLLRGVFMDTWGKTLSTPPENPFSPKVKNQELPQRSKRKLPKGQTPYTETLTETTITESLTEESTPNGVTPAPEPIEEKPKGRPRDLEYEVIAWAWNNQNGGHVGRLKQTLTGGTTKKDGKNHQPYFVADPADALLILAFALWWKKTTGLAMPTSPTTLVDKMMEFRGVPDMDTYLNAAEQRLTISVQSGQVFYKINWANPADWPIVVDFGDDAGQGESDPNRTPVEPDETADAGALDPAEIARRIAEQKKVKRS